MDKTEARYSEIARIMEETDNWVTLQIDYDVPFWAKPPLSSWFSAASFRLFGVNEFTARLPSLILNIAIILLIAMYAKRKNQHYLLPAIILLTLPEFLIHSGVVSTDTALSFCIVLVMISFWETLNTKKDPKWKYLLFVGFGLGLLAKGPIIFILTLPPIFIWCLLFRQFPKVWKSFRWLLGILIVVIIAFPWYILAEQRSPGFFNYFIIGEHFKRFLSSGWQGDKYGFPKSQPLGMIWVFLFIFALPWIQLLAAKLWKNRIILLKDQWISFLLLWLLWTPIFFTLSKSLIHPYIMPVMVPITLLINHWWKDFRSKKRILGIAMIFPAMACLLYLGILISGKSEYYANSDKFLIENHYDGSMPVYHWEQKSYSSQFYTKGKVKTVEDLDNLNKRIIANQSFLVIIPHKRIPNIELSTMNLLQELDSNYKKGIYLYKQK
jgi:4-amino-4-deoxy-L-arabinose transferase-like glycosyltransferase